MSSRGRTTPPFNSPYQQAIKSTSLLHSPAYPSPARSDSEASRYPADSLSLYSYSQSFHPSGPPTNAILYPPSPQPTESWAHLSSGTSPLMTEAIVDPWTSGAYDHPVSRSPLPWANDDESHTSSLSSTRDMSIFSRESSVHAFPQIKLERGSEWATEEERHAQLTVSPERLNASIFPYGQSYHSPQLPKFDMSSGDVYEPRDFDQPSYEPSKSPHVRDPSTGITARTRTRRNHTTSETANFSCHICHKLFQRSYNHKTHMEIHNPTRKKEHICPHKDCERKFVRKTDLDRHRNSVHFKLKQFRCIKCDSHFARKDTLRRHEEDGCSRRNELSNATVLSRSRSMRIGSGAPMQYYHSPRPDGYDTRSPPLFRDDSFPVSPSGY
ncbi:hypothetical protein K505DRAFT_237133 [Melanomma pulvis-pyrius CBS 109.77]|uniref:C2H2-type domain-containing protein n=1 Tax=Melanomma pulvis-pyrius CBS 109.77 TaxID=1314802 RepID=A0A6A6XLE6_9PLEO|nr:hypothetical protein K505DRAFT_237133 [Melanomma pulvis-pyrius CBS 109.77]